MRRLSYLLPLLALACVAAFPRPTAAEGDDGCPAGYTKVGEQSEVVGDEEIVHPVCESLRPASADEFCRMKGLAQSDVDAIKAIDFKADVEQFEQFEALGKKEKAAFQKKALMAALDQGLEAAEKGVDAAKSLNPWSVNTAIKDLKARGYDNELLFSAMRKVAAAKNKPDKVEAYKAFVKLAKAGYEGYETGKDMREEPDNARLRFLLGALKVMQGNPELGLMVTGAEFGESLGWLYYLNKLQNERMDITDTKLRLLGQLSDNLKAHIDAMKSARSAWNAETGQAGDPSCNPAGEPVA